MADFDAGSGAGLLRLTVNQGPQDLPNNRTTVNWGMALYCSNGTSYNLSPVGWAITINGVSYSGSYTFDFRSTGGVLIASGSTVVPHNADGTKTLSVSGYSAHTGTAAIGGPINTGGSMDLSRIPRGPKYGSGGSYQNTLAYYGVGGSYQQVLVYYGADGVWNLVGA